MLTERAKKGIARILDISSSEDAKTPQPKIGDFFSNSKSKEEAAKTTLKNVQKPSEILRQKNITREALVAYLNEVGICVQKEQSKDACIRICLDKWHVKDDNFWMKRPRPEEGVLGDLSHLHSNYVNKEAERNWEYCIKTNKLRKVVKPVREQNILPQLKKQIEKENSELPSIEVLTESQAKELSNSPGGSDLIDSLTSVNSITEPKLESTLFTESSRIKSDAIGFYGKLPTSERQSDFPLNALSSVPLVGNTSSPKTTSPFCFSTQLFGMDHLSSLSGTKTGCQSNSDTPALSSLTSDWIYEDERETTELPSTQPFSLSVENDTPPTVSTVKDKRKSESVSSVLTSVSSQSVSKTGNESSKVMQSSMSKPVVRKASVSNVSVQTENELSELQNNCLTVSPEHQNIISSKEKQPLHVSSLSNPDNWASGFQNVNGSRSASPEECPNCKKQYFSTFSNVDKNELNVSSETHGYNKKRPARLSKVVASSVKQRRLLMPSKPEKEAPAGSYAYVSRKPLTTKKNKIICKREYPTSLPRKETLSFNGSLRQAKVFPKQPRYIPRIRPKQSQLPFKKMSRKWNIVSFKPKNDGDSFPQMIDEESLTSEQTSKAESSREVFSPTNHADNVAEPRRSSSVPPEPLRGSDSTVESPERTSEISAENENPSAESSDSPDLDQPLRHPSRKCCVLM